ncbi:hypothetical protein L7F22_028089 [Adiantum nelumboides]|nr:hypothetical protein [Adiantum nelumboides]
MRVDKLSVADSTESGDEKAKDKLAILKHKLEEQVLDDLVKGIQELNLNLKAEELEVKEELRLEELKVEKNLRLEEELENGVTVLTKEQVAEKELKYSEPYILPPANAKLQPMESASNWHTNALKEIAKLQYSIISRIDAMVKAKQSATPSTSAASPPTASQQLVPLNYNTSASSSILPRMFLALQSFDILPDNFSQSESPFNAEDLADAFNPSFRWGNSAKNLSAPHHSMPYDEQMADELDFNLANAFPEPDSISDSEPEVINEDDEVRRLNPVKMETDDVKVEEPSTSASTSSTSLKGVSKIGDMTIIDIDGLNQEQVWKVFEFIYNSVHYGVRYKELTQRKAVIMITAGFQGMLRYWWDDLNEASKSFILQGGIQENFENVITLFFAAMVIQFLGSQQKIKDRYKESFFRGKLCDLTKIKAYQQHMTHLMYQFPGGYFRAEYKQYYVNSFPSSFSNLVKERIKSAGLQIDDQITLAQINAFIDEVTDLECARMRTKKEFKQVKGFNSSFCNKETKSKDFRCAIAEKKCSCKVKNRRNKYGKKYKVARRTRKLSKEERKKVRCYIYQKEGHIAPECPKHKKRFGNAILPKKYEYEVVYCNRFEKHDIPIFEYMQYESEEDETSDSTSSESPMEAVSTFFDDTSSVMFNMVRKPYAFPKKAKVRAESSSSSPSTTSGSEESEPSWMKKRRPSTLNSSKKEQRDYRPLPLISNMVEQAEEIARIEEWRRMIYPGLRQNQGNLPSHVIQQTASTNFAIPKTTAKPSPSIVEKQLEKERQDRYYAEEHQLKAIQAMFSALEQVNHKIEQLHKLVLNTQSQSTAIEAKVDECHGELQYLIDKAAMSKIAKEPVSEWKLQRPVNTCQVIPFNEKEHVSYFSEVWIKLLKIPSFRVDALWDTGVALSYLNQELVPPQLWQKLRHGNIQMQDHVLKKINQYPDQLSSKKEVQSFVGCLQLIAPQYPQLAKDLLIFKALDRCKSFFWHERLTRAVQQIKLACSILPPLRIPIDKPLAVYYDASEEAWGGILCEIDNDEPIICRWASGRFSDTKTRYHSIQKELLAGVNAVLNFRLFLIGHKFILRSDLKHFDKFLKEKNAGKVSNSKSIDGTTN